MQAVFGKSSTFKKIVDAIKDLTKETNINVSMETGMTIQAMDSSHVTLVELRMKECFETFQCPRDELISLNLETLSKILKLCDNDAALELSTQGNKLFITSCRDSRRMQFQQFLLDVDTSRFDVPDMTYPISVCMPTADFTRLMRDMKEFGESLVVQIQNTPSEIVTFKVEGDIGEGVVTFTPSETVKVHIGECIECTLAIKYLVLFSKAAPLCEEVVWELGEQLPARLTFKISQNDILSFYLAPKCD